MAGIPGGFPAGSSPPPGSVPKTILKIKAIDEDVMLAGPELGDKADHKITGWRWVSGRRVLATEQGAYCTGPGWPGESRYVAGLLGPP